MESYSCFSSSVNFCSGYIFDVGAFFTDLYLSTYFNGLFGSSFGSIINWPFRTMFYPPPKASFVVGAFSLEDGGFVRDDWDVTASLSFDVALYFERSFVGDAVLSFAAAFETYFGPGDTLARSLVVDRADCVVYKGTPLSSLICNFLLNLVSFSLFFSLLSRPSVRDLTLASSAAILLSLLYSTKTLSFFAWSDSVC